MSYKVTAPLVIIANADGTSGDWYGYDGALVPQGLNDKRCKQLVEDGMLETVSKTEASEPDPSEFDPAKGGSVPDTLAYVGDDADKAKAVLELEQAKGDDARSSLVKKLEAIANPGS